MKTVLASLIARSTIEFILSHPTNACSHTKPYRNIWKTSRRASLLSEHFYNEPSGRYTRIALTITILQLHVLHGSGSYPEMVFHCIEHLSKSTEVPFRPESILQYLVHLSFDPQFTSDARAFQEGVCQGPVRSSIYHECNPAHLALAQTVQFLPWKIRLDRIVPAW